MNTLIYIKYYILQRIIRKKAADYYYKNLRVQGWWYIYICITAHNTHHTIFYKLTCGYNEA